MNDPIRRIHGLFEPSLDSSKAGFIVELRIFFIQQNLAQ